jgi:hypothetical protein
MSITITGDARLTLEGCDACRVVVTSGGETGGGGVTLLATSWLPMMAINLFRGLVHGLGGLHLLIEPLFHLLEPFVIHGRRVDDFWRLVQRGNRG